MKDFREFLLRGNLVDLAVGLVIGLAFIAVVTAFVNGFVMPLIALIFGQPDFNALSFTADGTEFPYGPFITALITFVAIAAVLFFLVVKPVNGLMERYRTEPAVDETVKKCPECLSDIPAEARRCAFCTAQVG